MLGDAGIAETAEIRDARHPLARGHRREVPRALTLVLLEPWSAGHRVHEEVGDIHALARAAQAVGVGDVPTHELAALTLQMARPRGVAHETAHARSVREQGRGQPAADEAGGSRYECVQSDALR